MSTPTSPRIVAPNVRDLTSSRVTSEDGLRPACRVSGKSIDDVDWCITFKQECLSARMTITRTMSGSLTRTVPGARLAHLLKEQRFVEA